ncbi:carboxymuconolactone decarboxylase family protein [Clostridium sp.]|uniref:carboxymuconolactone decarboxylase family protein n=1 Tax=Clostridium sp. TaxID=1506 RepID=UPI00359F186F
MESRYELGVRKLKEVDGTGGTAVVESLKNIAPDLGKYIIEFAFGDIYTRPVLDLKQRELITLSALATLGGCETQLEVHINGSLNVGISKEEIIEVFLQCIPYIGFPKVLNAVSVAKDIFLNN